MNYRNFALKAGFGVLLVGMGFGLAVGTQALAFTAPTVSPPGGSVPAPINTGSFAQTKSGALTVDGTLTVGDNLYDDASNGGYVQLNPSNGEIEVGSGSASDSYIDFKGDTNLSKDYEGRILYNDADSTMGFFVGGAGGTNAANLNPWGLTLPSGNLNLNYGNVVVKPDWPGDAVDQLELDGNQVWNDGSDLYLQWAGPTNSNVVIGGQAGHTDNLDLSHGSVVVENGYLYVGSTNQNILDYNQLWNQSGNLYLQYNGPNNSYVYVGGSGTHGLNIPNGSICLNGSCINSWPSGGGAPGPAGPAGPPGPPGTASGWSGTIVESTPASPPPQCFGGNQEPIAGTPGQAAITVSNGVIKNVTETPGQPGGCMYMGGK